MSDASTFFLQKITVLRMLLEQGLIESLVRAVVNGAHRSNSNSLFRDIHVLLVAIATKLLESPGTLHMQAVSDMHAILNHVELGERCQCGSRKSCVVAVRNAQMTLLDGELDAITARVMSHSGFRFKSAISYLASTMHAGECFSGEQYRQLAL